MLDKDSDEEQNSDGLDDDLDDNNLDEDNLDEAKIEALFAPTTRRAGDKGRFPSLAEMRKSCHLGKADFIAFIEVEKLMIKRKWSLRHIILLYTRFGRKVRGLSHALLRYKEISDSILRYADPISFLHHRFGASGSDSCQTFVRVHPSSCADVATRPNSKPSMLPVSLYRYTAPWRTKYSYAHERTRLVAVPEPAKPKHCLLGLQSMSQYTRTHPDRLCKHNPKLTELWIRCTGVPVVEHMEFVDCHKPDTLLDVGTARNPPDIACSGPRRM
ncbi:hypothetical protein V8E54_007211 [Elaphomyces granulatus]